MPSKIARSIDEQIVLLEERGMTIGDRQKAYHHLSCVSYHRFKGYWWDMQADQEQHIFKPNSCFEDVVSRYEYDKELRLILFDAIETIEIALRTKLIYYLSRSYTGLFYAESDLFEDRDLFVDYLKALRLEFMRSREPFVQEYKRKHGVWEDGICVDLKEDPDAWEIFELASFGTLSKVYKNLKHQLPEKARIANDFGLNLHTELSSWLEAIAYLRNLIAHHSRILGRTMVKRPMYLKTPKNPWVHRDFSKDTSQRVYPIITSMLYMCHALGEGERVRAKLISFIKAHPDVLALRLGFPSGWDSEPIWREGL